MFYFRLTVNLQTGSGGAGSLKPAAKTEDIIQSVLTGKVLVSVEERGRLVVKIL